jgi:hypothetical protein
MKMTARVMLSAALLCAGAAGARAQGITIDTNDVKAMYAVATTTSFRADTLTNQLNIGTTGATSWDYSALLTHTRMNLRSVVPSTTPYFASNFPTATHALSDTAFTYSFVDATFGKVTLKGTGFNYMTFTGGNLLDWGFKGTGNAYIVGNPFPAQGAWTKSPAAVYYSLPMYLSKTWTTTYVETLSGSAVILGGNVNVGPTLTNHTVSYTIDAYGALKIPGGSTQEALRIRKVDRFSTTTSSGVRVGYMILAKNGASVQFTVADTSAVAGTASVSSIQWTNATPTAVRQVNEAPAMFSLAQNYPNPFNPSTMIRFALPERQAVTLRVYNLLGEEVATIVNGTLAAGEHVAEFSAKGLATGMYLYKLQAGSMTQTKRMLLVR